MDPRFNIVSQSVCLSFTRFSRKDVISFFKFFHAFRELKSGGLDFLGKVCFLVFLEKDNEFFDISENILFLRFKSIRIKPGC